MLKQGRRQRLHRLGGVHVAADVQVEVVALDLGQVGHVGKTLHVLEGAVGLDDAGDVLTVQEVVGPVGAVVPRLGRVHEQHPAAPVGGPVAVQHADGDGDAGPEEQIGGKSDDRLEQVGLDHALPDLAHGAVPEQDAAGHHHAHPALDVGNRQHVQQEGQVATGLGRDGPVAVEAVVGVSWGEFVAPVLQAEGQIGDDSA